MSLDIYPDQDHFWTDVCGIQRHCDGHHPGKYYVVALPNTMDVLDFFSDKYRWTHRAAVMDDFGSLVRVAS